MVTKFLLCTALVTGALSYWPGSGENDHMAEWKKFKADYNKNYGTDEEEELRKGIFMEKLNFVEDHHKRYQRGEASYDVEINEFSDLTADEFESMAGLIGFSSAQRTSDTSGTVEFCENEGEDIPDYVDWRERGAVTEVKHQNRCGSCWAFSAVGCIESHNFLLTNRLVRLSEQHVVDCSCREGNIGCRGGWPIRAFLYVKDIGGIATESSYPYKGEETSCFYRPYMSGARIQDIVILPYKNETKLQFAVATKGPVSVCINAGHIGFQTYKQGVYWEPNCTDRKVNHAVLVVGYGTSAEGDYWLVKNSWGNRWGDRGYIKMARNRDNMCGIASFAIFPIVY